MTDEERAIPPYEGRELAEWRDNTLADAGSTKTAYGLSGTTQARWRVFPSRPTLFTGHFPDVHGVTQTDGLAKRADDSQMRWLEEAEVPTLGHWFRAAGYDTVYKGKWHMTHADLVDDDTGTVLATNDEAGVVDPAAVQRYLSADVLDPFSFLAGSGLGYGAGLAGMPGIPARPTVPTRPESWLVDQAARRRSGDVDAQRPFVLVASFVNPSDIVLFPAWARRGTPLCSVAADPPPVAAAPQLTKILNREKPAVQAAYRASCSSEVWPCPPGCCDQEQGAALP
ncbi:MAG: sulfatase-like hydrolase/transferase [Acidimicrobiales bacterium]